MIPKNLGYIILEGSPMFDPQVRMVDKDNNGHIIAEAILQTADEVNRNHRIYPKEELFPKLQSNRILELLNSGYLLGEAGHPLSKELVRQQTIDPTNVCVRFLKLWTEGDNVKCLFTGTNNSLGETIERDLREGYKPAFSLRALGSVENTKRGAVVRNLTPITWDCVIFPSHPGAYTQKIVSESAGIVGCNESASLDGELIPITDESIIKYIKSESANLKYMNECFDFMYDKIQVDTKKSRVTLTEKGGHILVVNLESYINNEIRNYCTKVSEW